jgi:hypothetical protein
MALTEDGGADLEGLAGDRLGGALPAVYDWLQVHYRDTADHVDKLPAAARLMLNVPPLPASHRAAEFPVPATRLGDAVLPSGRADVRSAPDTY